MCAIPAMLHFEIVFCCQRNNTSHKKSLKIMNIWVIQKLKNIKIWIIPFKFLKNNYFCYYNCFVIKVGNRFTMVHLIVMKELLKNYCCCLDKQICQLAWIMCIVCFLLLCLNMCVSLCTTNMTTYNRSYCYERFFRLQNC